MRLLIMTVFALAAALPARAQLSPGPLARPHRAIDGATQCLKCHQVSRREAMDRSCLACHQEIGWLVGEKRGLHPREGSGKCSTCHPDHAGVEFKLVAWTRDSLSRFDHRRAGWALEGAHAREECTACHTSRYRHGRAAALAPAGAAGSWTGLDPACLTCHTDVHRGTVAANCSECHDAGAWAPAPRFDHDQTRYPLTGKHVALSCSACHPAGRASPNAIDPALPPVPFGQCSACHEDPHAGRLGARCSDCHVTTGFEDRAPGGFDHGRTRYPLRGRHAAVECAQCHAAGNERKRPPFGTCGTCHADAHAGTALLAGGPADCAACHDERSFRTSTYTAAAHAQARYPLEGKHRTVACNLCHKRVATPEQGSARVVLRPAFSSCGACHADAHQGQTQKVSNGECAACHSVQGWDQSLLSPAAHAPLGFALVERHAEVRCTACHESRRSGPIFRLGQKACSQCHEDPHAKRYPECTGCHTARAFRPSTVDSSAHSEWRLPLEGAHRAVPCAACHPGLDRPATGPALLSEGKPPAALSLQREEADCAACHSDPHGGQFIAGRSLGCEACHGVSSFLPADRFDHDRDVGFRLDRGHERVACTACHLQGRYRGAPTRCEACHR